MLPTWRRMPLLRAREPFDHPDWLFELKHDGFRALAIVEGHRCRLLSRHGHDFKQWPQLQEEVAHAIRAQCAVLDGEIVCLKPDGRSDFYALMFRRAWPYFYAFDLLSLGGKDLREWPLLERKRRLAKIIPYDFDTRLRLLGHAPGHGGTIPSMSSHAATCKRTGLGRFDIRIFPAGAAWVTQRDLTAAQAVDLITSYPQSMEIRFFDEKRRGRSSLPELRAEMQRRNLRFLPARPCEACGGQGFVGKVPCPACATPTPRA